MIKYLMLAVTLCALAGFTYGLVSFFRKRSALYARMVVFGVGSAMMGRMFETLQLFLHGEIHSGFQVGELGVVGCFLFFFTSNYGQVDSLVDDGTKKITKSRLLALLAPACIIGIYIFYYTRVGFGENAVVGFVEAAIIAIASYYHLKHLIIPDVENGVVDSLRWFNLLALIYAFLCMAEMVVSAVPISEVFAIIVYVLLALVLLLMVPVMGRGVKRWTT